MTEHRGTSFYNSCVKVPVDPYSRQPTPSYERPRLARTLGQECAETARRINFAKSDSESSGSRETLDSFLEFLESIPDYGQVHHLSNEQFKQRVEYLKRKQRLFLKNLRNSADPPVAKGEQSTRDRAKGEVNELKLSGKKCYLEESRASSPVLFPSGTFAGLAEDQDLLTYRYRGREKEAKTMRNKEIYSASKAWSTRRELKSDESLEDSDGDSIETKSLPASSSRDWHPTVPKPFSFTLREDAERYMSRTEMDGIEPRTRDREKTSTKKRRVRPVPITSKIPLYDKLLAEKEERSRVIREESALNLMSQVRPFRLECERRAWRSLARSSPEIRGEVAAVTERFRAKPVPKNLFGTDVYDRMLEDEYYRQLKKKVRAAELMKSSSLPPSMARRERARSAFGSFRDSTGGFNATPEREESSPVSNDASLPFERSASAMNLMPTRGNNLAAILRCQASRQRLEREIKERMEEKRRDQETKLRESATSRKPEWRALRSSARHERDRDLGVRACLRRDEAREQAERHRAQMEMMLSRVTRIPTLFERHSQSYQSLTKMQKGCPRAPHRKKKKPRRPNSSSVDSYISYGSNSRPNSGSLTSSSGTLMSLSRSSNSSSRKKGDRGQLKVSIKETAELIEDPHEDDEDEDHERSSNETAEG